MVERFRPGQSLRNGVLVIEKLVGHSRLAEIYQASMTVDGKKETVCFKSLHPQLFQQAGRDLLASVQEEVTIVSELNHPGVSAILLADLNLDLPYVVEENLDDGRLATLLATRRQRKTQMALLFSPTEVALLGYRISSALSALHQKGIFHGSLNPNLLCFRRRDKLDIVILDAALSRLSDAHSLEKSDNTSTLVYLPPERTGFVKFSGSASSDLYGLGTILYECVTGSAPFSGSDGREIINRLLTEVPKPLHHIRPDFPPVLGDLISKLLRKDPNERYASASGLAADFERCLAELKDKGTIKPFALGRRDSCRELNDRIPMIGRKKELDTLSQMFELATKGESGFLGIAAPSGTGKSRLFDEFFQRISQQSVYVSSVKFSEFERNTPLWGFNQTVSEHIRYLRSKSPEVANAWQKRVTGKLGAQGVQCIVDRFEAYSALLGVKKSTDNPYKNDLVKHMVDFIELLPAGHETNVLLFEDVEWADRQTLELINTLAQRIASKSEQNLLVITNFRASEINSSNALFATFLSFVEDATYLRLGPLTKAESFQLIEHLLDEKSPEIQRLQDFCFRFTAGNPFYIFEYLKSAIQSQVFAWDPIREGWFFYEEKLQQTDLSYGIAGLANEKVKALIPLHQAIVGIASIAENQMNRSDFFCLLPLLLSIRGLQEDLFAEEDSNLMMELSYYELVQRNIFKEEGENFKFFHKKLKDAAYELLSEDEKQTLHFNLGQLSAEMMDDATAANNPSEVFEAAFHICRSHHVNLTGSMRKLLMTAAKAARNVYAFDRAQEYLEAIIRALETNPERDHQERFAALALLADILASTNQVAEATKAYDLLLQMDCSPEQKISFHARKADFYLNSFRYQESSLSSASALEALGQPSITSPLKSWFYVLFMGPFLAVYSLFIKTPVQSYEEAPDSQDGLRFHLMLKYQIAQFFIEPFLAAANLIHLTLQVIKTNDPYYLAMIQNFWACAAGSFGLKRLADRFFNRSFEYFKANGKRSEQAMVLISWAFNNRLQYGELQDAKDKLENALNLLSQTTETFWKSLAVQSLALIDLYGLESSGIDSQCKILEENVRKGFVPAHLLSPLLRRYLESGQDETLQETIGNIEGGESTKSFVAFDSVDHLLTDLNLGDYYELTGDLEKANSSYTRGRSRKFTFLHRVAYKFALVVAQARVSTKLKRGVDSFKSLFVASINVALGTNIVKPQTYFEYARLFHFQGLNRLARSFAEKGIRIAAEKRWKTVVAEGRLVLGQIMAPSDPEMAVALINLAKQHFSGRSWKFSVTRCDRELESIRLAEQSEISGVAGNKQQQAIEQKSSGIRQQVEVQTLIGMLIKLSAINDGDSLFKTLLESICQATGAELSLLYFEEDGQWVAKTGHNIIIDQTAAFSDKVDQYFVQETLQSNADEAIIRNPEQNAKRPPATGGSALIVPLISERKILAYCYLANSQLEGLFDQRSLDIARPIATQAAIALSNIRLKGQLAIERDEIAKLHQTLEIRVMEQTRDIKSIMSHINMGICTISGQGTLINKDYSHFLESLFEEKDLFDKPLLRFLSKSSSFTIDDLDQARNALLCCIDNFEFTFETNSHLLPKKLSGKYANGTPYFFELDWIPICDESETIGKILMTVNDVTALRGLEALASQKDEQLHIMSEILSRSIREWSRFIHNSRNLLKKSREQYESLPGSTDPKGIIKNIFLNMHTLKGNARGLGFKNMTSTIHQAEEYFSHTLKDPQAEILSEAIEEKLTAVEGIVGFYETIATQKLARGVSASESIDISRGSALQLYNQIQKRLDHGEKMGRELSESLDLLRDSLFLSFGRLMQHLVGELDPIASELGKAAPRLELDVPSLWCDRGTEELLRNTFVHLLRNSLDHGLHTIAERQAKNLDPAGTIRISAKTRENWLDIYLEDDGRGLNLKILKTLGLKKGLLTADSAQNSKNIAGLIFLPDLSTANKLSNISGRGVGMSAVRDMLIEAGGSIDISFKKSEGLDEGFEAFNFVITLPLSLFQAETALLAA